MRVFAIVCIVIGALIIFTANDSFIDQAYLKIIGFIFLMFGLYKCTKFWVEENKTEEDQANDSEDHKDLADKN